MKVLLIDDEKWSLAALSRQLTAMDIAVIGTYVNPEQGLAAALRADVDLVFLDIEMPKLNGIELAETLLQQRPDLDVVFVTAYNEYAVAAFELNAVDYILKPVSTERLTETVRRVRNRRRQSPYDEAITETGPLVVRMFGELSLATSDWKPVNVLWRTAKGLELFAFLVHQEGGPVDRDTMLAALWPEASLEYALPLLFTTVYQVHRALARTTSSLQLHSTGRSYRLSAST